MERPEKGPLAALDDDAFARFVWRLGHLVFNTVPAAAFARHKWPLNTVADYLDVTPGEDLVETLAKDFWKDLAARKLDTEALCRKWFWSSRGELAGQVSQMLEDFGKGERDKSD